jgi:hypothetical protein
MMPIEFEYTPPAVNAAVKLEAVKDAAAHAGAEVLLEVSRPGVPVDTGVLQASGEVLPAGPGSAVVRYSAKSRDGFNYAIKQHEDMTLNHPHGGHAKYLEAPIHADGAAVLPAIAEVVRTGLRA